MPVIPLKKPPFIEPVLDLTFPGLGKTAIFKLQPGRKILNFVTTLTVTASATGGATKTVPRPSWGIGNMRFKLGNYNRTRLASELFGANSLQARNSRQTAGTVKYFQAGALITATLNGIVVGNTGVLIDSPEDVALQGALANDTATVAVFALPWMFAEYFRKDPMWGGEEMGLMTAYDDGTGSGQVGSILGTPYFELDIPAATGVAGTMTSVDLAGSLSYSETLAAKGSVVNFVKQKVHNAAYAVGDVELAKDFDTKDILQRFSVLTVSDQITKIKVMQGSRIIRQFTFEEGRCHDLCAEIEGSSSLPNRFDCDLDFTDDPTQSLLLSPVAPLSIVATFATAADNPASVRILADYYGPVEN